MKSFEASGRTVEEAISAGLQENGLSIGDVNVEILEEGSKGLFGLFGSSQASFSWRKILGLLIAIAGIVLFRWEKA